MSNLKTTLLLNSSYEPIGFISFRKLIKLFIKEKIDIISEWEEDISWASEKIKYPATVRLRYYVRNVKKKLRFSRKGLFRRDNFQCQYCAVALSTHELTVDHILPRSRGGISDWLNTVSSCKPCNWKKKNRTPEEANMQIINIPFIPKFDIIQGFRSGDEFHNDWDNYLKR